MAAESNPIFDRAVTRRGFLRGAGAAVALAPMMTEARLAWAAQPTKQRQADYSGKVLLDANENPLGPCDAALDAIQDLGSRSGRYDFPASVDVAKLIMRQEGLKEGYLTLYPGSSEPLQYAVMAFTSPGHGLVSANPTYEAPGMVAQQMGVPTHTVPLRSKDYAHDVRAMAAADPFAGCFYICNPNNPSGTVTTREDIYWLLEHKPRRAVVVVDEAYIHYSDAKTVLDYALDDRDVIVLRSFSKIYGMAGLRFGFAVGRPDLLARLQRYGLNPLSLPGVVAAQASLMQKDLVQMRKTANAKLRDASVSWLKTAGYSVVPSQTNFFMVDVKRPGEEFAKELAKRDVYVGRSWPIWPQHVRVTVGTENEMETFQEAFAAVAGIDLPAAPPKVTPALS